MLIFLTLSCGDPSVHQVKASPPSIVEEEEEKVGAESLQSAKEDLEETRYTIKCMKRYIKDQQLLEKKEIEWQQPDFAIYELNNCESQFPKK